MVTLDATAAVMPRCPVPGHENSRVVLGGRYGKPGRQRQLYVCQMAKPGSSAPTHRFTAPLTPSGTPAQRSAEAEGPEDGAAEELRSARHYQFTAYEIASGLAAVSRGTSYARAGQQVRERAARRWGTDGQDTASRRHGTLVSDWVEVYAEALWQAQAPYADAWPETVLVGALPLTAGGSGGAGARGSAHKLAFAVFVAMAYRPDGSAAIFAIGSSSGTGTACWTAFLQGLADERRGRPARIVGDGSEALARAVDEVWGREAPQVWTDEAVLRDKARRICHDRGLDRRDLRLWLLLQRAWRTPQDFDRFTAEARRYRLPELDRWLSVAGPLTARQFAVRSEGVRLSRRAVPAALAEFDVRLGTRRATFGNQARTDRLLRLMALDLSGVARVHAWTDLICAWLERTGGRPVSSQRAIADRGGLRSLRPGTRRPLPATDPR
ncbi:hypothetical protein SAMN05216223_106344 [Actinacidiphila yanglinensis]|uniref:Uncharacterized protein n=1 Tax=Actinacidiphila yanglinensis TaxID=310779 RepID=A0A1H6BBH9_9ACTN|nr:hypothetical protein [Actinacidiphila yanglinensis]SEG57536.1 hypothetical protein SAMN05216223_106344 [Actinacidiphila yanglinensis]